MSLSGYSQNEQADTIKTEDIEIVKEYTPFLEDGKKQSFRPVMPAVSPSNRENLEYDVPSQFIQTQYQPDEIRPLPIELKDELTHSNFYLKGGYGNMNNPLIQLGLSTSEKDNYTIGLLGNYQSVKGKLFDDQKMSDAYVQVFGSKEVTNGSIDANVHFQKKGDFLYGYDHDLYSFSEDIMDQNYNSIGFDLGFQSVSADEDALKFQLDAGVDNLSDRLFDNSETLFGLAGNLEKQIFDGFGTELRLGADFRSTKTPEATIAKSSESVFNATPILKPELDNVLLELGVSLNNDEANGFKIFPNVGVEIPFAFEEYTFYAGWKGKTVMNSLYHLTDINARISPQAYPVNYTREILTPAGLKGAIDENMAFNLSISREQMTNAPLFIVDTLNSDLSDPYSHSTFDVLTEESLSSWRPSLTFNYQFGEYVNAIADLNYNFYSTETFDAAFHMPKLDAGLTVEVTPVEQLKINGGFQALSGIETFEDDSLNAIFNANIGGEFSLTDNFSIFLDANNLTNQEFQRWKNYPAVGMNILAGIVFSY